MRYLPILLFLLLFFVHPADAIVLEGQNKEYAGKKINFYTYSDPVTQQNKLVFSIEFDSEGIFKTQVQLPVTTFLYSEFGIYRGLLFVKPDENIQLLFPPLREKSFAEQKNPFFEPVSFWFASENGNQLTDQVSEFDQYFRELTDKYFNRLYFRQSITIVDSVATALDEKFPDKISETLALRKKLKLKILETDALRLKTEQVAEVLSTIDSRYWNYPSFIEFFEKIFSNQLNFASKTMQGELLMQAVSQRNTEYLLEYIKTNYKLKDDIAKLALLKMLHDAFYSGEFPQNSILQILNSSQLKNSSNETINTITKNVIDKLEFLLPGNKAPVICLQNIDGNRICTDQFDDKFKYLIFADTEMIVCREQLKYLKTIQEKFEKYLQIVVILRKTDLIEMKMFLDKQKIPGIQLIDENGEYIEKYRVKSFPEAFLLNENHEIVFVHTKAPLDGFEEQFGAYLQKELFERQRNQAR